MALPLPENKKILIVHKKLPGDYRMPSLEAAIDHFALGLILHGDRRVITPNYSYELHQGDVNTLPPLIYHQTIPVSQGFYESILIKFSPDFIKPLTDKYGIQFIDNLFEVPRKTFDSAKQAEVEKIFWDMLKIHDEDDEFSEFVLQGMLCNLLITIYKESLHGEVPIHKSTLSQPIFEAVYYMEKNYSKHLNIEEVAKKSGYSVSYFSRIFQEQLGHSFSDYLTIIRIRRIESDLLTTDKSITEIALDNGFQYPGNMTSLFKSQTGLTPFQYRKNRRLK